jgi:hypothetical protein
MRCPIALSSFLRTKAIRRLSGTIRSIIDKLTFPEEVPSQWTWICTSCCELLIGSPFRLVETTITSAETENGPSPKYWVVVRP